MGAAAPPGVRSAVAERRWPKLVASVLFTAHAVAIAVASYPFSTYSGDWPRRPFIDYLQTTQQMQLWEMFVEREQWRGYRPSLLVRMSDGSTRELGALMPGFRPAGDSVRTRVWFQRALFGATPYLPPSYVAEACDDVARALGERPRSVSVIIHIERIRDVEAILDGAPPLRDERIVKGPSECP